MKEAFISAEDKNFYTHNGVDFEGVLRAARRAGAGQQARAGRLDHHPAGRQELPADQRAQLHAQDPGGAARVPHRVRLLEGKDPRALSERDLSRPRQLRRSGRGAELFRQVRQRAERRRGGLSGGPAKGSEQLPAFSQARPRHRAPKLGDRPHGRERLRAAPRGRQGQARAARRHIRALSPDTYAAGYFAEEVRRELSERYGEKKLYEGGLSVRTTLDPKMQVMARKALVEGLVRYDEAHGWRGADPPHRVRRRLGPALGRSPGLRRRAALAPGGGSRRDRYGRADRPAAGPRQGRRTSPRIGKPGSCRSRARAGRARSRYERSCSPATSSMSSRWTASPGSSGSGRSPTSPAPSWPWIPIRAASSPWWAASRSTSPSSTAPPRRCASRAPRSSPSSTRRRSTTATRHHRS